MTNENNERSLVLATIDDVTKVGTVLVQSGFFKDAKSAAQAVVKVLAGRELGIGPVRSMNDIYVIEGKTTLSAPLIGSLIKASKRYDYRVKEHTDKICTIEFFQGGTSIGESSFTMADATTAGLAGKGTWKQYPRNMLFSRALSNGARWYCPDVFGGSIYTPDEFDVIEGEVREVPAATVVDQETGEITEAVEAPKGDPAQRLFWARLAELTGLSGQPLKDKAYELLSIGSFKDDWLADGKTWGQAIDVIEGWWLAEQELREAEHEEPEQAPLLAR